MSDAHGSAEAHALIARMWADGFAMVLEPGPYIVITPGSKLTPELREQLVTLKTEVVRALAEDPCATCGATEWRLALIAFDGTRTCVGCLRGGRRLARRLGATEGSQ